MAEHDSKIKTHPISWENIIDKSGCGKTMAAAHLLHNSDDKDCPKRALMVNAGGSKDFATDFSMQQSAANAAPHLVNILCASLKFQEKKDAAKDFGTKVCKVWSGFCRLGKGCFAPMVDEPRICLQDSRRLIQIREAVKYLAVSTFLF